MLRLNKNLQTVKLKYILITLVFTSRLFATLLFLNCYFASWRRKRRDGALRAIKDQHRQRASLVSTDGAKVGQFPLPYKEYGLG